MKAILFLLFCVVSANCQVPTAKVTFFRERSVSAFKQSFEFKYKRDYVAPGMKWDIYMDGKRLLTLHRDRMATFSIPAGHHDFKIDHAAMVPVDVGPNSHIFFRPRMDRTKKVNDGYYVFEVVDCSGFLDSTKTIKTVKPNDIFTGDVVPADQFSDVCKAK